MATLATDTPRVFEVGHDDLYSELPVIASDIIYDGAAVGESGTTGTFRPLVSGDNFGGFAVEQCDNSSGSAADRNIKVKQQGIVKLSITGASAAAQYGDDVYATDDAVFTLTAGGSKIGTFIRWETSTTALVRFQASVLRTHKRGELQVKTADYTVVVNDSGKTFSTDGAAGTVVFSMPAAVPGLKYRFHVGAAQELRIDPDGTETISLPSTGVAGAAGKYLTANAAGETVDIECVKAGTWAVFGYTGTWTAEG
jgi:hypothetical protein